MRGRFGRLALAVGALAAIIAWLVRRRESADTVRGYYETARERYREAREQARERLSERIQRRGQETVEEETARGTEEVGRRPGEEMRSIIRESVRRSRGEA